MSTPVNVLIVEDSEEDAILLIRQLRKADYDVTYERVETPEAMSAAMESRPWNIVIADYSMPHFNGEEALRLLRETGIDVPFILVSGTLPEEKAIEIMRAGAHDFILKGNLSRLAPAVTRELLMSEVRRERRNTEEALRTSEENFRAMFDYVPAAVFSYDRNGMILYANSECEQLFEIPPASLIGHSMFETLAKTKDRKEIEDRIAYVFSGGSVRNIEWVDVRPDGRQVYILTNVTPVCSPDGNVLMGLSLNIDITERKLAEQRENEMAAHKREFYRRTILAATEGKLEICDPEQIHKLAGPPIATPWEISSPEDTSNVRHAIADIAETFEMEDSQIYNLALCAGEAMTNAVKHASGGVVSLHEVSDSLLLIVADSGTGIAALNLPDVALTRGYSTAGTLGMGYKTMISLADRVYLSTGPGGTTVAIKMSLTPTENPSPWSIE